MLSLSAEAFTMVVVLVLMAVAVGTFAARFFIAASRSHVGGGASNEDL